MSDLKPITGERLRRILDGLEPGDEIKFRAAGAPEDVISTAVVYRTGTNLYLSSGHSLGPFRGGQLYGDTPALVLLAAPDRARVDVEALPVGTVVCPVAGFGGILEVFVKTPEVGWMSLLGISCPNLVRKGLSSGKFHVFSLPVGESLEDYLVGGDSGE